jgi:hypothetical protein
VVKTKGSAEISILIKLLWVIVVFYARSPIIWCSWAVKSRTHVKSAQGFHTPRLSQISMNHGSQTNNSQYE